MSNGRTRSALRVLGLLVLATGVLLSFAGGASAMTDVAPTDGGSGSNAVTTSAGSGGFAPAAETCDGPKFSGGGGSDDPSGGGSC